MKTYSVSLVENDPHGNRCGELTCVEFFVDGQSVLRLLLRKWDKPVKLLHMHDFMVLYGAKIKYETYQPWHGNKMVNSYTLEEGYFKALGKLIYIDHATDWEAEEWADDILDTFGILPDDMEPKKPKNDNQLGLFY